jgi:hypothetical protein
MTYVCGMQNLQTGEPDPPTGTLLRVASGKCFLEGIKVLLHPLHEMELPEDAGRASTTSDRAVSQRQRQSMLLFAGQQVRSALQHESGQMKAGA